MCFCGRRNHANAYHPEQELGRMTRKPRSLNADHRDKRKMLAKLLNDSLATIAISGDGWPDDVGCPI